MKDRTGCAVFQEHGAVEQRAASGAGIGSGEAHEQGRAVFQFDCESVEGLACAADEAAVHEEVAWQVTHESQFGGYGKSGALGACGAHAAGNQRGVSIQIARGGVDLEKRNTQGRVSV